MVVRYQERFQEMMAQAQVSPAPQRGPAKGTAPNAMKLVHKPCLLNNL